MFNKTLHTNVKRLDANGSGEAVFATLETWDKDSDWTERGAFGVQNGVKLVGAHQWQEPPLGIANVFERGAEAIAAFQFNLDLPAARDWYTSLKFAFDNGGNSELSYGFDVLLSENGERQGRFGRILRKLAVFEISFVMRAAGENTRIVSLKSCASCGARHDAEPDLKLLELEFEWQNAQRRFGQYRDPHIVEVEQAYVKSLEAEFFRLSLAASTRRLSA